MLMLGSQANSTARDMLARNFLTEHDRKLRRYQNELRNVAIKAAAATHLQGPAYTEVQGEPVKNPARTRLRRYRRQVLSAPGLHVAENYMPSGPASVNAFAREQRRAIAPDCPACANNHNVRATGLGWYCHRCAAAVPLVV
jgi:hypothetical protein